MVKRSLKASVTGIQQAKRAFARLGWTQENLAFEVNLKTRQPIWRFFSGQPVDRHIFLEICSVLQLNWREIAFDPPAEFSETGEFTSAQSPDIDALVKTVVLIFITLRNFAQQSSVSGEFNLLNYIRSEFLTSGISEELVIETLLGAGRVLLLLDGMDEVLNLESNAVLKEISSFSDKYYKNRFVAFTKTNQANQLLVDCLNSNCEVTAAIWEEIEATLLLPTKELPDREWQ